VVKILHPSLPKLNLLPHKRHLDGNLRFQKLKLVHHELVRPKNRRILLRPTFPLAVFLGDYPPLNLRRFLREPFHLPRLVHHVVPFVYERRVGLYVDGEPFYVGLYGRDVRESGVYYFVESGECGGGVEEREELWDDLFEWGSSC